MPRNTKRYLTTFGFIDLLFNMLVGFVFLFFIAYILINPIADDGKIDPPDVAMLVIDWDDNSKLDIDIWVKDPKGNILSFTAKTHPGMHLEKDDIGGGNDTFEGKIVYTKNQEVVHFTNLFEGKYLVNLHMYATHGGVLPADVIVRFMTVKRYKYLGDKIIPLSKKGQEAGVMAFYVDDKGNIVKTVWQNNISIINRSMVGDPM
tara:strand:- start:1194 stop:1805 length:612 start_codon:yes stop_codon:yes gene_type:complete